LSKVGREHDKWFACGRGSWRPARVEWLAPHSGPQVPARTELGNAEFTPIEEDAPGSYVEEQAT
jgi:polyhydroxyalkanoate synthase subunit PhaC